MPAGGSERPLGADAQDEEKIPKLIRDFLFHSRPGLRWPSAFGGPSHDALLGGAGYSPVIAHNRSSLMMRSLATHCGLSAFPGIVGIDHA